jgi:hypothetical protein
MRLFLLAGTMISGLSIAQASATVTYTTSTAISSALFPAAGQPAVFHTVYDGSLAAGYYSLDTYAPVVTEDPHYEITFTTVSSVPEPMSVALLGAGMFGLGIVKRRRSSRTA